MALISQGRIQDFGEKGKKEWGARAMYMHVTVFLNFFFNVGGLQKGVGSALTPLDPIPTPSIRMSV